MKRDQDWDSMKHTAFLFKKPKCPDCGEKMLRQKEYFSTRGAIPDTFTQEMASVNTKKVKYYYYTYTCPKCGKKNTLSELAK